jgi:hypothetical protein
MGLFLILRYNNKDKDMNKEKSPFANNIASPTVFMLKKLAEKIGKQEEFQRVFASENINQFVSRLSKLTDKVDTTDYELGRDIVECNNKVKGDMFELFTVLFFDAYKGDRSINLHDVKWAYRDQVGYDFIAKTRKNSPAVIQSKFVGNATAEFNSGRLETFFKELPEGLLIEPKLPSRILFTTAGNVAPLYIKEQRRLQGNFLIVDRKTIKRFTNGDQGFWAQCKDIGERIFTK